ncbi:hypothetical protein BC938DRAFT_475986 [Jimgerdemannia flammicorona]|uniref:Uncharacterized protein n=1 Tax=Jimgerdemannia flammicorona TaxID=994334 RepID=A0A433QR15_9FUNG|nr:hypothetical protein BC938DRAFT_475986 [Jimgerdemannia flammicorona]
MVSSTPAEWSVVPPWFGFITHSDARHTPSTVSSTLGRVSFPVVDIVACELGDGLYRQITSLILYHLFPPFSSCLR